MYTITRAATLRNDTRLANDPRVKKRLAQSIKRVLDEDGQHNQKADLARAQAYSNDQKIQMTIVSILTSNDLSRVSSDHLALLDALEAIQSKLPAAVAGNVRALVNEQQMIKDAAALCTQLAGRIQRDLIGQQVVVDVFGQGSKAAAEEILGLARANLVEFGKQSDPNKYRLIPSAKLTQLNQTATGGYSNGVRNITFGNDLVSGADVDKAMVVLLHEATHTLAVPSKCTRDHIYRGFPGFTTAPADIKLQNAAHYEELGWQVFKNENAGRTFVPAKDLHAVTAMVVTNAWVMSGWLKNQLARPNNAGAYKENASKLLGLTLHRKERPAVSGWAWFKQVASDLVSSIPDASYVDLTTAGQVNTALGKCMGEIQNNNLQNVQLQNANLDAYLTHLVDTTDGVKIRNATAKTVKMIKALAALYLITVEHLKRDNTNQNKSFKDMEARMSEAFDPGKKSAIMDHYALILEGHVQKVMA